VGYSEEHPARPPQAAATQTPVLIECNIMHAGGLMTPMQPRDAAVPNADPETSIRHDRPEPIPDPDPTPPEPIPDPALTPPDPKPDTDKRSVPIPIPDAGYQKSVEK
ncbi:hypothetical protein AAVH_09813, partial [Aphelenchoides avenae]